MAGKRGDKKGRPCRYIENVHDDWGWTLASKGYTHAQIAKEFGIGRTTLDKWRSRHPSFSEHLKNGKGAADAKVEKSLYKRALGYETEEKRITMSVDKNGNGYPSKIETIKKHVPPDVAAIIYWLKNRMKEEYRDSWNQKTEDVVSSLDEKILEELKNDPEAGELIKRIGIQLSKKGNI